jgi:hypothetical protein
MTNWMSVLQNHRFALSADIAKRTEEPVFGNATIQTSGSHTSTPESSALNI